MRVCVALLLALVPVIARGQAPAAADPAKLTLDRVFNSADFRGERVPAVKWLDGGVSVFSTLPGGSYGWMSGTSMDAPHVAGVAALILSADPALTPAQVEDLITATAAYGGITV